MNPRRLQALIEDPPPKSPYFTLPDVAYIDIDNNSSARFKYRRKTAPNTITKIWGPANKMAEGSETNFLANLLRFAKIDFNAMAKDQDVTSGSQIKKRLSTIIRKEGYRLDGDRVVSTVVDGETHIIKTTEITITETDRDDTQDISFDAIDRNAANPKVSSVTGKAITKSAKKRKRIDGKGPKEVLKKKQKKTVKKSMGEDSA